MDWRVPVRAALLLLVAVLLANTSLAADTTLRLRIAWGGGVERIWSGSIRLSEGRFSELEPLGIEANEPGSIWLSAGGIEIREPTQRAYDGVDVLVTADLAAKLSIALVDPTGEITKNIEVPLTELVHQSHATPLDDTDNRLLVTRSPGDRLRVRCQRDNLVFAPGENLTFELAAHLADAANTPVRYSAMITASATGTRTWSEEYEAGAEGTATTITLRVPEAEGVYDLTLAAVPTRLRSRISKKSLAERKVQLIVLDKRPPTEAPEGPLARVVEIDPMHPRWWERLGTIPLVPGLRKGPLGNGESAPWQHPTLGPLVQLGPGGAAPNISWEAYPLPLSRPGQPHVLEIEYPNNVPQAMGLSVIEPNAAGAVMPIGLDSGVYVSDEDAENPPQMAKHRVVFWPRTKTPLLLVTNRRAGARAVYGKITVLAANHSQFPSLSLTKTEAGAAIAPAFPDTSKAQRLWAGYLDRPLFVENFSAPEALDTISRRSLDDWNTMYQGGQHLLRYLKHVGYGGLMMSVWADGSSIYPSQHLQPTPRYDTGVFFGTGQDPLRKDALEMLFRMFDREGLTLIPALHFASPLPELEALKREGEAVATGIEWIGADGQNWQASHAPRQGLAPYYNLLDPRVQDAMLTVIRELGTRYAAHPSFGGLAMQLSAEGYAQLPGDNWGYDDRTIARFEQEAKTKVPGEGPTRFAMRAKHLAGPARAAWLSWRADAVADFHRRVEREVAALRSGAKLYLAGGAMLDGRHAQTRLRPTLPKRAKLDDTLVELGIRAQAYRDEENIVLLRPQHLKPTSGPLPAQAADLEINFAPEMDRLFATGAQPASLFFHEPQKARLASFDLKSPFGPTNTYTWLVTQMSPAGDRNRRRFVHSLAALDARAMFDGGWLLPLGQEEALREILSVYRLLPDKPFETVAGEFQPVTIRKLVHDGRTYVYFVNDSPWSVTLAAQVDVPSNCQMHGVGDSRGVGPLPRGAAETSWKITLRPYDLAAAEFDSTKVKLRGAQVQISDDVRRNLQQRIQDLGARVAALKEPQPLAVIENADFEAPQIDDQITGWTAGAEMGATVQLDAEEHRGGLQSLKITSTGPPASITSAPFTPPTTGRLAIDLWLKAGPQGMPNVRIAIEGQWTDGKFDPYGVIPAIAAGGNGAGEWVRYSFPVDDVPSEGLSSIRIRLDLMSAGEVWVDDLQVFDLPFSESERVELSKLISLASVKLEAGHLADCARLLEGYWPQFLVANVPLTQAPIAQRPREPVAPPAAKKPGVLDNLRSYVPKLPLR